MMRYKAICMVTLWVCLWTSMVQGQNPVGNLQFLPIDASLSQNTVTTLHQDKRGFLWIGTRNGLNRYDGINMEAYYYDEQDSTSINNNYIRIVYETRKGDLWIGTEGGGLAKYIEATDSFERYTANNGTNSISGNWIYCIYEDEKENLWVGTQNNGLNYYDTHTKSFTHYRKNTDDPFAISDNNITGVVKDRFGHLWVSTWGEGLNLFDPNTKRFINYRHDPENAQSISSNIVRILYEDNDENLYVGTDTGLDQIIYKESGHYVFKSVDLLKTKKDLVILSVMKDHTGKLWVGTENNGIISVDTQTGKTDHMVYNPKFEYSLQNNSVWSLFEDNEGTVWIGTFNKGLFKIDPNLRKFRRLKHSTYYDHTLSNNSVSSFAEDKSHNVWVGTDGGGLDYWDRKTNTFKHYNKSRGVNIKNEVLALMIDSHDNLWIGTWYGGLLVKESGSDKITPFKIDHPFLDEHFKENVFSILEDREGRIWISLYREGLVCYDPKTKKFLGFEYDERDSNSISSNFARCLLEDVQGNIWVGTEGGGLNRIIQKEESITFERFLNHPNDLNSICSNTVLSIHEGDDGNLWLGTTAGLNYFDVSNKKWTKYGKKNGLPDEVIYAIEEDGEKNLWLSSNKGLTKFNVRTQVVRNYDRKDGLQALEFFKNSSFHLSTGELLFGGVEGFNIFHPSEIKDSSKEPKVYLSRLKVSNRRIVAGQDSPLSESLYSAKEVHLDHDQNDFSFEFSLLNFTQSTRNEYAYQLVDYDQYWQEAGNRREAYYTNVPPGHYTFRVKGTSNDGRWSANQASIEVYIASPWYATTLAYVIYFMLAFVLLVITFRIVVNRERLQNQLQLDQMEISKMQELDEMKSSFFANISHEFRSPLTLILGPLKMLKDKQKNELPSDQMDVMIRNGENLLNLINQLLELSKLESGKMRLEVEQDDIVKFLQPIIHSYSALANQKFINYKVNMPKEPVMMFFDKEKLEKIMVNLISNALKFTSDFGNISVSLDESKDHVSIIVSDNGVGIPTDELTYVFNRYYRVRSSRKKSNGTGIGLSLTKELVEIQHATITVDSVEGTGSSFTVRLLKGRAHFSDEDMVQVDQMNYLFEKKENDIGDHVKNQTVNDVLENLEDQLSKLPIVLVVEDNKDIQLYIKNILDGEYKVIMASDGNEGLEIAQEKLPDIIISDVMMPGIDGLEFCKQIKEDVRTSHIPVILLTAKASNESAVEGFEVGADYYMTKPFNARLLALRVRNALKTKEQIKEQFLNTGELKLEPSKVKVTSKDKDFIDKAIAIVEANMDNSEFYVDDLGKELGLSRMQLYRKMKALIDQSANEFIRSIRLKRAAQLLEQDQLTISEITYQVGFNDLQYFRDCFKKHFGVNPSEYIARLQNS